MVFVFPLHAPHGCAWDSVRISRVVPYGMCKTACEAVPFFHRNFPVFVNLGRRTRPPIPGCSHPTADLDTVEANSKTDAGLASGALALSLSAFQIHNLLSANLTFPQELSQFNVHRAR